MRILYTFLLITLSWSIGHSQSDRLYSLFIFNKLQYNPAYAGAKEKLNIGAHYRHQWQGVVGAPKTITAFAHAPFAEGRSGVGLSVISDDIGLFNTTIGKVDYAYRIGFKNDHKLSLGLSAQVDNTRINWELANLVDNTDSTIPIGIKSRSVFNVGIGAYYSSPNFYLGVSAPRFMRNSKTSDALSGIGKYGEFRPYYFMGGFIVPVGNNIHIRPSLLISHIPNAPFEADFNLSVMFLEKFWVGASYRLNESIDAFVKFPLTKKLTLAVGMDYATTELNRFTRGSGEIMIEYLFHEDGDKVNNIRFF